MKCLHENDIVHGNVGRFNIATGVETLPKQNEPLSPDLTDESEYYLFGEFIQNLLINFICTNNEGINRKYFMFRFPLRFGSFV